MFPLRTILHPTDFSDLSDHALKLALDLARDYSARLIVLHVLTPPVLAYGADGLLPDQQEILDAARQRLANLPIPRPEEQVERRLVEGDPVTEILRLCEAAKPDLIVMGANGRGGLERLLLGSVADTIIQQSLCPVMVVRHPSAETVLVPDSPFQEAIELCPP